MKELQKKLNILVITSTYPRFEDDYAVPWMRETHRRLADEGHEVTVLAPAYRGLASHTLDGLEVVRFRYALSRLETLTHEEGATYKVRNPWMQLLAITYILMGCVAALWLTLTRRYDAIHVHWPFPHGIMGQVAAWAAKAPLVAMSHGAEFALAERKPWIKPFLRHALRSADLRIANSSSTAKSVRDLSGMDCVVLPYGTTVMSAPATIRHERAQPRVLFTGRLIERKGLPYLLQAVPQVLKRHSAKFIITGDGDQRSQLESMCRQLGLDNSVEFVGFLSKEDLKKEYAQCDIWVNPGIVDSWGDAEGLGVGSIEAYSYRKPVIASAVGGIPDTVVDGQTGYLVPQKDSDALAHAICDLLDHPDKAREFGRNGFKFARQTFSWESIINQMEEYYHLVAAPYKRGGRKQIAA